MQHVLSDMSNFLMSKLVVQSSNVHNHDEVDANDDNN